MAHPQSPALVVLLTAMVAFGPLSTDLYLPALPAIMADLDSDVAAVQLTLSVFMAGLAAAQLICGPLSDRFGRRPVLQGGLVLYIVASVACLFADSIEALVLARFFQAAGACCGPVLGRAVVRDVYAREDAARLYAYMGMAVALGPVVGPVLGGYLTAAFGWQSCFLVLALFGVVILTTASLWLGETNGRPDRSALDPARLASNYRRLFGHGAYRGYVVCISLVFCGIFSFISGSSFLLMDRLGLAPVEFGLAFGAVVAGYMIGSFSAARLTRRLGLSRLIEIGTALGAVGGLGGWALALGFDASVGGVIVPMVLFMVGAGLTLPNAFAGAIGPFPEMAGLASALLGFVQMTAGALAGMAVGQFHDGSAVPMMTAIGVSALLGVVAYRRLVPRPQR